MISNVSFSGKINRVEGSERTPAEAQVAGANSLERSPAADEFLAEQGETSPLRNDTFLARNNIKSLQRITSLEQKNPSADTSALKTDHVLLGSFDYQPEETFQKIKEAFWEGNINRQETNIFFNARIGSDDNNVFQHAVESKVSHNTLADMFDLYCFVNNDKTVAKTLIDKNASDENLFYIAIEKGDPQIVKTIINIAETIEKETGGKYEIRKNLLQAQDSFYKQNALHVAMNDVAEGVLDSVLDFAQGLSKSDKQALLNAPDSKGRIPLDYRPDWYHVYPESANEALGKVRDFAKKNGL